MDHFIETERLLLRPYRLEDAQAMTLHLSQYDISKMLARVPHPYTLEDAQQYLSSQDNARLMQFGISKRTDTNDALIGGIWVYIGDTGAETLGYWLAQAEAGQGLMTEAVLAVLSHAALLGYNRIEAATFIDNPASANVLLKSGFEEVLDTNKQGYCAARQCVLEQRLFIWHWDKKAEKQ